MATEEEEIQYLLEVERVTEEYFRRLGYNIDMSEMSVEELEAFFLDLPAEVQTGLRHYVAWETTGKEPTPDPLDFGQEMLTPVQIGGVPILIPGLKILTPARLAGRGPLRWLGRALGLIDDAGDAVKLTGATGPQMAARSARAGRYPWSNVPPAAAGRIGADQVTMARSQVTAAFTRETAAAAPYLGGPFGRAMAGTAAVAGAYGVGQVLGSEELVVPTERSEAEQAAIQIYIEKGYTDVEAAKAVREDMEGGTLESDLGSKARGADSATDVATNLAEENSLLRAIFYQDMSDTAVFDKLTNWVTGQAIMLVANGQSLYNALVQHENVLGDMELYHLGNEDHYEEVKNYFMTNWENVPAIANKVRAAPDPRRQGGGQGMTSDTSTNLDDVVDAHIAEIMATSPHMLIMPSDADGGRIGVIPTFDGTMHGTISSLNDITSGGRIGPMQFMTMLEGARPEQLVRWQQELYSWGYLERPPEVWGQLVPDHTGIPPTLAAAQTWQVELFNTASYLRQNNISITPDGTPRADRLMDVTLGRRAAFVRDKTTTVNTLRQRVVDQVQDRLTNYLTSTGQFLPQGAIAQLQDGVQRELDQMNPSRYERLFGQGGSPRERLLAENLLKEFYDGSEDWQNMLVLGDGRNEKFYDYAQMVGAVSEQERMQLEAGGVSRGTWGPRLSNDPNINVRDAETDVAVAAMLKFIGDESGSRGFAEMTVDDLVNGLGVYLHTIGQSRGMTRNYTQRDLIEMATRALNMSQEQYVKRDTALPSDIAHRYIESEGIGGGVAGYKYREIVNELDRISRSPGYLRTPNA